MNHIDEKTLVQYVLDDPKIKDQRREIEEHLNTCAGCSALHREISEYYADVEKLYAARKEERSSAVVLREHELVPEKAPKAPFTRWSRDAFPVRAVRMFARHPVRSSFGVAVMGAAIVALFSLVKPGRDTHLAYARAKDEFLIAYNKEGDELWRRHVGKDFDYEKSVSRGSAFPFDRVVSVVDVDGDGSNEVMWIDWWADSNSPSDRNVLYCYNSDGRERWRYDVHRNLTFGSQQYSDDYRLYLIMTGTFIKGGSPEVIAVAHHIPEFPTVVMRIDARSGKLISEYVHPGYITFAQHNDIDGNGVDELFLGGTNNAFRLASLSVVSADQLAGHAPSKPEYTPPGMPSASEKYYLLFPHDDLQSVASDNKNWVGEITFRGDGTTQIGVGELLANPSALCPGCGISYFLDQQMRVTRLMPGDFFVQFHQKLESEGKLSRKLDEKYYEDLRQGVQYWNGKEFQHEPTMNRKQSQVALR